MKFRNVALLLIGLMIFQIFPCLSVDAAESEDSAAVRLLVALNIMEKDEYADKFWNEIPVKRAEMAKILCRLYNLDATPDPTSQFIDVSDDYRGYVEAVVRNGYMSGIGGNKFGAKEYITRVQLVKIYVTMLDGDGFANAIGGYPEGYITVARRLGLSASDVGGYNETATQLDVAKIIYKAMNADMLQVSGIISGGASHEIRYETVEGETFLTERLDIYRHVGILKANDATALGNNAGLSKDMVQIGSETYYDPEGLCDEFLGCEVVAFEKKSDTDSTGEIIYAELSKNNEIIELDQSVNTFKSKTDSVIDYYKGDSTRHIKLGYAVNMIFNGKSIEYDINEISADKDEMKFIDNNGDGVYDVVIMYEYSDYMVDHVDRTNERLNLKYGEKSILLENQIVRIYRNGIRIKLSDLEPSDTISVAVSRETDSKKVYTIQVCRETVAGNIDSISNDGNGDRYIRISGKKYKIGDYYNTLIKKGKLKEIEPGISGTFYCNAFGEIVTSEVLASSTGVAYLADWGSNQEPFDRSELGILLFTEKGKLELLRSGEKLVIDGQSMRVNDIVNDAECIAKLNKRELVQYTSHDGIIKELDFAKDGYSASEFSLDVNGDLKNSLQCTRTTVLDNKWKMTGDTIVFRVPTIEDSEEPGISSTSMDESLYSIVASPFIAADSSAKVALYDIRPDNSIGYALWPTLTNKFASTSPLIAVTSVNESVNEDGDTVVCLEGFNETKQKIEVYCRADINLLTMPKTGDVLQYTVDYKGDVDAVSVLCSADADISDYGVQNLVTSKGTKVFGEVFYVTDNQLSIYFGSYHDEADITPNMCGAIVADSGRTIVEYNAASGNLYPIEFSEITNGDVVFAAINSSNTTRMLIVYR